MMEYLAIFLGQYALTNGLNLSELPSLYQHSFGDVIVAMTRTGPSWGV
jgi:hypothetical protein